MIKTALQIKTIGLLLKEKRKEQKLELKQVSEITRISVAYLAALEEGNYSIFQSEVYLKGFLKNYAKYLGINTEKALAMYRRENERKQNEATINMVSKVKPKNLAITFTPNRVIAGIAILAILLIIVYLGSYVGKVLKKPDLALTSPIALTAEVEGSYQTDANYIDLSGTVELGSRLYINDQELKLNNFETFTKQFKLELGQNKFVIKAESQFGRDKTLTLVVTKETDVVTPTPAPTPMTWALNIVVSGKDATITVLIDGDTKTSRIYKVGSTLDFTATKTIEIKTNQPSSLKIKINDVVQQSGTDVSWDMESGQLVKK
jgi:cytoskeletal protein RodZ